MNLDILREHALALSPSERRDLAKLLSAKPVARKPSWDGADLATLDQRTAAERWIAGEDAPKPLSKSRRAGAWRVAVVTFADGTTVTTGSYCQDDRDFAAETVRFARTERMQREWGGTEGCRQWAGPRGYHLTRAIEIPEVSSLSIRTVAGDELRAWRKPLADALGDTAEGIALRKAHAVGEYQAESAGWRNLPAPVDLVAQAQARIMPQSASEPRQAPTDAAGSPTPAETSSAAEPWRSQRNGRIRRTWAVVIGGQYVAYVGPKAGAAKLARQSSRAETEILPLPKGWRRGVAANDVVVENARRRVRGERQRVRISLAA